MKNLITAVLLACLFVVPAKAQTRVLVGLGGAEAFDNSSLGVTASLEVPFAKRFELNLKDTFSPLESKVALGGGRANTARVSAIVWLTNSFGVTGAAEDSNYNVTKVTKDANYWFSGVVFRKVVGGLPARFSIQYIRQFNNGITPSGLESSHLQGGDLGYTMRFGCLGAVCVRTSEDIVFGRVLTQGNPICDGTYGVTGGNGPNGSCPRGTALGGGFTASITAEFPRHRGHEYDAF
jgi:hypothetical protein